MNEIRLLDADQNPADPTVSPQNGMVSDVVGKASWPQMLGVAPGYFFETYKIYRTTQKSNDYGNMVFCSSWRLSQTNCPMEIVLDSLHS